MKDKTKFIFILLGSLFLIFQLELSHASELHCSNFTGQKEQDCNYITNSGYTEDEEQELLNALWEQSYEYETNWNPTIPNSYNETIPIQKSDWLIDSDLILASKIFFFGVFNYIVFSITKTSFILKWLSAV